MGTDAHLSSSQTPAERVTRAYGGDAHVAVALSRQGITIGADAVRKWKASKEKKGGGGLVPAKYHAPLLKDAREQNIDFTATDLVMPELVT